MLQQRPVALRPEHLLDKTPEHDLIRTRGSENRPTASTSPPGQIPASAGKAEAIAAVPSEIRAVVEALQALGGIAKIAAVTIVSKIGAISRFESARQLMGYGGLVPSEFSNGKTIRRGRIAKTGNAHLRRVIVEPD